MCIDMRRVIFFGGARAYAREDLNKVMLTALFLAGTFAIGTGYVPLTRVRKQGQMA